MRQITNSINYDVDTPIFPEHLSFTIGNTESPADLSGLESIFRDACVS